MVTPKSLLRGYLLLINVLGLIIMGWDKGKARGGRRRIPEKHIFLLALCGGGLGVATGMRIWRHKVRSSAFRLGIPILVGLNGLGAYYISKIIRG